MLALIRHGQTEWNRLGKLQGSSDVPLNDTGREQARDAVDVLRATGVTWDAVVSSPLGRARETAQIVADGLGIRLGKAYPQFIERDYGKLEGMVESEANARWPHRDEPSVESLESVVERGMRGLLAVQRDHRHEQVVVVCHGTIIHYTLNAIAGTDVGRIRNGTVSAVEPVGHGWRVTMVNDAPFDD